MRSHVCSAEYEKINDYFHCPKTKHAYREISINGIEFHSQHFRNNKAKAGEFKDGKVTNKFHENRHWMVEERVDLINEQCDQPLDSLLDIGAGAGTFANHAFNDKNLNLKVVECLELDNRLITEIENLGFQCYTEGFLTQKFDRKYDIVTAWHVLEHVSDIALFMDKAVSLSNKYVIIEVPHKRRLPYQYDGHQHYFTEDSMKSFIEQQEYDCIYLDVIGIQKPSITVILNTVKKD